VADREAVRPPLSRRLSEHPDGRYERANSDSSPSDLHSIARRS
jgi:hypothetical protein